MDMLREIFDMQRELDGAIVKGRGLDFSYEEWMQKKCLALINEAGELMNEVNYKWWKNKKELDYSKIGEELIDILHFLVSMCLDSGLSADDAYRIYAAKNSENRDRQEGKSQKDGYKPAR
ncbi:MAG: dUTPase [Clostridiales bacterium]|jgi:dimeric dUTPase (all-alpha-NTP-PPase superfamily)|nr:dUTPase [Clostridiales bacterium]